MAQKAVSGYFIRHQVGVGQTSLTIHFTDGGFEVINNLDVNEAGYLVDLLRNEKPLGFDTANKTLFTTTKEPVGEGE